MQLQAVLLLAQDHQQFALGNPVKIVYLQALVGVYENILHRPLEHSCRRAHRVMPVDVAVHEIVGEHQRLDGGDPLARDRQPPPFGVVFDGLDESVAIDGLAEGHAAEQRIAQEIVDLVGVEGAGEDVGQQYVTLGDLARLRTIVDDIGDAHRVDVQLLAQDPGEGTGGVLDQPAGPLLVADEEGHQLFEGVRERVVADVVEQSGGQEDADVLVLQLQRRIGLQKPQEKLFGQMVDAERVLEAGVTRPRVDEVDEAELADFAQPLEIPSIHQRQQRVWKVDVPPDRVADGLTIVFEEGVHDEHLAASYRRRKTLSRRELHALTPPVIAPIFIDLPKI